MLELRVECFLGSSRRPLFRVRRFGCFTLSSPGDVGLRGTVPDCAPQGCFYNFPSRAQYVHDCDGVVTGGSCNVSCAEGWSGPSSVLSCSTDGGLLGTFPRCSFVAATQTLTSTTVSTATATSTNTDELFEIRVEVMGRFLAMVSEALIGITLLFQQLVTESAHMLP